MAITGSNLTTNFSATAGTTYTTASITPQTDALILAVVGGGASSGANTVTPTLSGNSLTWVQVDTTTVAGGLERGTLFRAMGKAPTAGAVTITYSATQDFGAAWSIVQFTGVDAGGTNGSAAVVQESNTTVAAGTSISLSLAALKAGSATAGLADINSQEVSVTPGSGYTQLGFATDGTQGRSIFSEWEAVGTTTVNASWGSAGDAILFGVEIAPAKQAPPTSQILNIAQPLPAVQVTTGIVLPAAPVVQPWAQITQAAIVSQPSPVSVVILGQPASQVETVPKPTFVQSVAPVAQPTQTVQISVGLVVTPVVVQPWAQIIQTVAALPLPPLLSQVLAAFVVAPTPAPPKPRIPQLIGIPWEDVLLEATAIFLLGVDLKVTVHMSKDRRYAEDEELLRILYGDD